MSPATTLSGPPLPRSTRRLWRALDLLLALMIIGPIVAPLFHASGLWLFDRIAHWIIYPIGQFICPQDQHALPIAGHVMAVCSRCYAAIGGLVVVRMALTGDPAGSGPGAWLARRWSRLPGAGRAAFIVGVIGLWQLDLWVERMGWWAWEQPVLIATGPLVGLAIGFLAYGTLARLTGLRAAWASG